MKLKMQVLNEKQVLKLKTLGFDVEKHSSVIYAYATEVEQELIFSKEFIELNGGASNVFGEAPYYFTMTIGDIINVLPYSIETYHKKDFETYTTTYFLKINQLIVSYVNPHIGAALIAFSEKKLINNLFKTLNFMIKTGYINK